MTITLNPQIEAKLLEKARREGQDPSNLANDMLSDYLEAEAPDSQISTADVREAIRAERAKPMEQYIAEQRVKQGHASTWPPRDAVKETAPGVFVDQINQD